MINAWVLVGIAIILRCLKPCYSQIGFLSFKNFGYSQVLYWVGCVNQLCGVEVLLHACNLRTSAL